MAKLSTLFMIALLLVFTLTSAARTEPSLVKAQQRVEEGEKIEIEELASCDGVSTEECLRRRTLEAHTDYIYTQNNHH